MNRSKCLLAVASVFAMCQPALAAPPQTSAVTHGVVLASDAGAGDILVDPADYPVVSLAADLLADDVNRVSGKQPHVLSKAGPRIAIIAGTLGHSRFIDELQRQGKLLHVDEVRGQWEATLTQVVENPLPGVSKAYVIVGSDRRGTAYGLMQVSHRIGVSPWYWWADVPVRHSRRVVLQPAASPVDKPGVRYRGIFINDEDWGLIPWVKTTFDPASGNVGPKTYERVFELMLRLRLNYFWPAMHGVSREFGSVPENAALADRYAIVAGASHCEPMLFNNIHWNATQDGPWDYALNPAPLHRAWEQSAEARGRYEAVWTIGIRGIHDAPMQGPNDIPTRIQTVTKVLADQRSLLHKDVSQQWGPVAQVFLPYKEVLPIYDGGLKVPDDVTLGWVDDNFGYIRRFSSPEERKRTGGAGVYWHISYYGLPHSYTWINTTAPALIWEELHKAWENDAGRLWVLNVGDIKPGEIGIDFYSKLAWSPTSMGPDSQPQFLKQFSAESFDGPAADDVARLLGEFYHLGTIRKPELMDRSWAASLTAQESQQLHEAYTHLLAQEKSLSTRIPAAQQDAYTELVGFPVRVLGESGLIFLADRSTQTGQNRSQEVDRLRTDLTAQVLNYNQRIAGGKWNGMMPGLTTGKDGEAWSSQVRWPWPDEATKHVAEGPPEPVITPPAGQMWLNADRADRNLHQGPAAWRLIEGLGPAGKAMAVLPASLSSSWSAGASDAPSLEFDYNADGGAQTALLDFLPTFRIYPGMQLRVALSIDGAAPKLLEVPGSSGAEDERGQVRSLGVQNNYVRARFPLPAMPAGRHIFRVAAVDPGVVLERVSLP